MPIKQNLKFMRDQDLVLRFSMVPPRDITGWAISWQMSDSLGGTSRITKTVGGGITITNAGKGILEVAIADSDTASLTVQSYVWDLKRTDAGSEVFLAEGQLILERGAA